MRKSFVLIAAFTPFAVFAGLALPGIGESRAGSVSVPSAPEAALDLNGIPVQPVTGPLAVRGVGGDDDEVEGLRHSGGSQSNTFDGGREEDLGEDVD